MLILVPGRPALSAARRARAFAKAKAACDGLAMLDARWVHLVVVEGSPTDVERAQLAQMLTYGPHVEPMAPAGSLISPPAKAAPSRATLWVAPRLGTTSPWSSKATDIAHVCGLANVRRIERTIEYTVHGIALDVGAIGKALSDRMTESVIENEVDLAKVVEQGGAPRPLGHVALGSQGAKVLREASTRLGLALADDEIEYLVRRYRELGRDPTDVELMMFAQANSEHCRHKIFNAEFWIDGVRQEHSLFQLIKQSTAESPGGVLSAYKDNAAVVAGNIAERLFPADGGVYRAHVEPNHILGKVETHNHPTAISPFPGAATGSGGEIRDEGATGRGAKPKAGLVGFTVSDLRIPGALEPWEAPPDGEGGWIGKPSRIASALDIMTEGPLGGAAFNNEFGRPAILGYFRTYEHGDRGYHKPVMLAGGIGTVRPGHVKKAEVPVGAALIVLGGPAFLIGLGGGAASSLAQGASAEDLDFASVQRDNAEIQRRCQEVIDRCWAMGDRNPIASIHDVGAGGLSNAMPELVHDAGLGAKLDLRAIPTGEPDLSPLELWSNEAQERYVLAIPPDRVADFAALCARERAPWAQLGTATPASGAASGGGKLVLADRSGPPPVDIPLELVLGKPPKMIRRCETIEPSRTPLALGNATVAEALDRVLGLPTVADKTFLVTIGDRTVGGMIARDPMVGRFQVPVADHALTLSGFDTTAGEVMALGERPPVALLDAAAASRLALGEVVTNLASAPIGPLGRIKLSCNWMAAAGHPGEDARLYAGVRAASETAVALGMAIPVGKDSMSMRTMWGDPRPVASTDRATGVAEGGHPEPPPRGALKTAAETMAELEREVAGERLLPKHPEDVELEQLADLAGRRWRESHGAPDPDDSITTGRFTRDGSRVPPDRAEEKILGPASEDDLLDTRRFKHRKRATDTDEITNPYAERDLVSDAPTTPWGERDQLPFDDDDSVTMPWAAPLNLRDSAVAASSEAAISAAVAAADALSERVAAGPAGYIARGTALTRTLAPGTTRASGALAKSTRTIVSPVTLVVTAFGPVTDVRLDVTPELRGGDRELLLVDLGGGKGRLGGSCLAQVYDQLGDVPPDLDDPTRLLAFYDAIQQLVATRKLAAYHDRSDGGLVVTLLEMAFAGGLGLELDVSSVHADPFAALFSEELGAVVEVATADAGYVRSLLGGAGARVCSLGRAVAGDKVTIRHGGQLVLDASRGELRKRWSHVTHQMALRRDDPSCANEEHASRVDGPGLSAELTFAIDARPPAVITGARPRVAILREQGVNGQLEMAAAFTRAGFDAVDVHMTDLIEGRADLSDVRGAVACGGFSFGDVLGAGRGWASCFRYNPRAKDALARLAARNDTFLLGVCNGCQALADLADQLPGASAWPRFVRNRSEQFEARLVLLRIEDSPSIFFRGMAGSRIPVANAHGEGRAELDAAQLAAIEKAGLVAARFVDGRGTVATTYPANPNGSPGGVAALTTADGRLTIMMPHPERVFRTAQLSWHPPEWGEDSPWMRMFYNARAWVA